MREDTFKMRERGCQMRHFRAIAQDLAALCLRHANANKEQFFDGARAEEHDVRVHGQQVLHLVLTGGEIIAR